MKLYELEELLKLMRLQGAHDHTPVEVATFSRGRSADDPVIREVASDLHEMKLFNGCNGRITSQRKIRLNTVNEVRDSVDEDEID